MSHVTFFTANLYNDYIGTGSIDVLDRRPVNFSVSLLYIYGIYIYIYNRVSIHDYLPCGSSMRVTIIRIPFAFL